MPTSSVEDRLHAHLAARAPERPGNLDHLAVDQALNLQAVALADGAEVAQLTDVESSLVAAIAGSGPLRGRTGRSVKDAWRELEAVRRCTKSPIVDHTYPSPDAYR